ncbi:hypothetical protein [Paenarthrobacter nitroguajacolicus]|uniref:hypothetical protein n=1 Tax=Paenarthrobacter nitroguajacolicus TaxID=211146 RepID=UPI0040546F00
MSTGSGPCATSRTLESKAWTRFEPWMTTIVDLDTGQILGMVDGRDAGTPGRRDAGTPGQHSASNTPASTLTYSGPASFFTNDYAYWCANGNNTSYRTETYGELYLGGTRYSAAAYDELTNVPCGT